MNVLRHAVALGMIIALGGWEPANAASAQACDAYARSQGKKNSRQGQVIGGSIVGSAVGLGIIAITGGAAVPAAAVVGGGIGGIAGGGSRKKEAEKIYRAAYQDCMAGKVK
jgi:hypothetical protein